MKLIKLNPDHFIVVDKTEIKVGDYYAPSDVNSVDDLSIAKPEDLERVNDPNNGFMRVTHSTECIEDWVRPDGVSMKVFSEIKEINLYSIKSLTDKAYDKAEECANALDWDFEDPCGSGYSDFIDGFVNGYNKAIEVNRYTEEDINKALSWGYHAAKDEAKGIRSSGYGTRFFESIQTKPKTEWDVEFVDRRLRLI